MKIIYGEVDEWLKNQKDCKKADCFNSELVLGLGHLTKKQPKTVVENLELYTIKQQHNIFRYIQKRGSGKVIIVCRNLKKLSKKIKDSCKVVRVGKYKGKVFDKNTDFLGLLSNTSDRRLIRILSELPPLNWTNRKYINAFLSMQVTNINRFENSKVEEDKEFEEFCKEYGYSRREGLLCYSVYLKVRKTQVEKKKGGLFDF